MKFRIEISDIDDIATRNGYYMICFQPNIGLISYYDGSTRINIYLTKMTVATCMNHPVKGKTQLFRKNVDKEMLEKIFEYPRKHTGKGYYKKKG